MRLPTLALVAPALLLQACGNSDLDACDIAIKATLRSPATYNRVAADDRPGSYVISYDAANTNGTPIRGRGTCFPHGSRPAEWFETP
jgi:hypothetical protein